MGKSAACGAKGSGKTYSALRVATGLAKECGSRIAFLDTENGRARYYADEFDFDYMQLEDPFTPEKYMEAIDAAVDCKANGTGATAPSVILMIESELFRTRIQDDLRASRTRACA